MSTAVEPVLDLNAVIAEAAAAALPAAPEPEELPTHVEQSEPETTGDSGAGEAAGVDPEGAAEPDEEAPDTDAPDGPAFPDGYVAVPSVQDQLATEFILKDAEGEVEVPALIVEYKANGKVRQDRLDQVVKLAQWGVYNEERDRKAQLIEQEYQQALATAQELEAAVAEREAQMERLLQDDEFLYAVREAYEQENSPEKRVERAEREKEDLRISYEMQHITQQGEQFYNAEIAPAVQMITNALPNVSAAEVEARLQMVMQAHAETAPNGQPYVPPSRYGAIRQYIVEDLAPWAQIMNARRVQPAAPKQHEAQAELDRLRIEAQKAKNLVGRATKPTGQAAKPAPKAATVPSTVDDAVNSALATALASFTTR